MIAATPPWLPYLAQAAKGVGRASLGETVRAARASRVRPPNPAGPRAGNMTRDAFLKNGGVYGGGAAGLSAPSPQRKPILNESFDLL